MARVGLVLGAGGMVGHAFHAGVLATLHRELGWDARDAEVIVGTSAGSLVGAMLRAGLPPDDLAARALDRPLSADGRRLVARAGLPAPPAAGRPAPASGRAASPARLARAFWQPWKAKPGTVAAAMLPAGSVSVEPIRQPMRALFGDRWPARPLWVGAVDLDRGDLVVFGRPGSPPASVADAVAASCAIPGWFEPVVVGGARYVDGGAHSPTNADLLAGAGLDLVIVSSPMSSTRSAMRTGIDVPMRHTLRLLLAREVARLKAAGVPVVTFEPDRRDQEAMAGNPLDPAKRGPVCRQVIETTTHRLHRTDLRRRLAALA